MRDASARPATGVSTGRIDALPEEIDAPAQGTLVAVLLMFCPLLYITAQGMLAPLLVELAAEFDSTVPAMGQLAAATSLAWAPSATMISPLSDRLGRKPLIVFGLLGLSAATLGASFAQSVLALFVLRLLGGIAGGALGPSVNAAAIDYFPASRRGQVLGLVTAGFSLAAVVGVPGVAALAGVLGWRDGFRLLAVCLALLALAIAVLLPGIGRPTRVAEGHLAAYGAVLQSPGARPLLLANLAERIAATALVTYLPAYLMLRYQLSLGSVGVLLSVIAIGALGGTLLGGVLANRPQRPRNFALCQAGAALVAVPLLTTMLGPIVSAGLGVAQAFGNSLSRPAYMWMVGQLSPERRGAVMGLNALTNQSGIVLGSALGGLALALGGYDALTVLVVGFGALAAVVGAFWLKEDL